MKLGIISDTHGYFHPSLPAVFASVDLIIHAGDIGGPEILSGLEALAPVRAVYGNVDGGELRVRCPEHDRFTLEGVSFWVTHIAGRPGRWQLDMARKLRAEPPDVFICGHSHILQIERLADPEGTLFLNPGAAGRQGMHRVKTCVRLDIEDGKTSQADVIHLDE
jgi:putative phosphoesterase